jgi:ASPIC and UnbV/FG-GAP-like repeat
LFKDITDSSGISYRGGSYGVAWGDFNNDGYIDLWVGNHGPVANLYQNQGNGTFLDITTQAFAKEPGGDLHGAAWADFDNDSDLDLIQLVGANAGKGSLNDPTLANQVYVNENGVFEEQALDLGLGYVGSRSRNPLWFDYNNDGLLDLLLGTAERPDGKAPTTIFRQEPNLNQQNKFVDLRLSSNSDLTSDLKPSSFGILSDLVGDHTLELIVSNPSTGISIYDSATITEITDSVLNDNFIAQDVISEDFNGDLLPDLYLTERGLSNSAFVSPDDHSLRLNLHTNKAHQGITFKTDGAIVIDLFTFGFSFDEINLEDIFIGASGLNPTELDLSLPAENDILTNLKLTLDPEDSRFTGLKSFVPGKDEGLYIGYDPTSAEWEISLSTPDEDLVAAKIESSSEISDTMAIAFNNDLEPLPDQLLINNGDQLIDRTANSGINSVRTAGVNTVAGDFDNDMDVDLYVVTANAAANEPNVLYDNQGDGTFRAISDLGDGVGSDLGIGDAVATADYNNDGFLDLFVTNGAFPPLLVKDAPYQLLENEGNGNHWLEINLEGVVANRDGIGAKVYVTAGGVTQLRQQSGGMHDQVQNDSRLHFGLGSNTQIEEIKVEWSSGTLQTIENVTADQFLDIQESV